MGLVINVLLYTEDGPPSRGLIFSRGGGGGGGGGVRIRLFKETYSDL